MRTLLYSVFPSEAEGSTTVPTIQDPSTMLGMTFGRF